MRKYSELAVNQYNSKSMNVSLCIYYLAKKLTLLLADESNSMKKGLLLLWNSWDSISRSKRIWMTRSLTHPLGLHYCILLCFFWHTTEIGITFSLHCINTYILNSYIYLCCFVCSMMEPVEVYYSLLSTNLHTRNNPIIIIRRKCDKVILLHGLLKYETNWHFH